MTPCLIVTMWIMAGICKPIYQYAFEYPFLEEDKQRKHDIFILGLFGVLWGPIIPLAEFICNASYDGDSRDGLDERNIA